MQLYVLIFLLGLAPSMFTNMNGYAGRYDGDFYKDDVVDFDEDYDDEEMFDHVDSGVQVPKWRLRMRFVRVTHPTICRYVTKKDCRDFCIGKCIQLCYYHTVKNCA